eukprot:2512679-Rhodomonas_salina.3
MDHMRLLSTDQSLTPTDGIRLGPRPGTVNPDPESPLDREENKRSGACGGQKGESCKEKGSLRSYPHLPSKRTPNSKPQDHNKAGAAEGEAG